MKHHATAEEVEEYVKENIKIKHFNAEDPFTVIITNPSIEHEKYKGQQGVVIKTEEVGKYIWNDSGETHKKNEKHKLFTILFKDNSKEIFLAKEFVTTMSDKELDKLRRINKIASLINELDPEDINILKNNISIKTLLAIKENKYKNKYKEERLARHKKYEESKNKKFKEFKKSLPIIPVGNERLNPNNTTVYSAVSKIRLDNAGVVGIGTITKDYTQQDIDKYNYIFGNFFHTSDEAYEHRKGMNDALDKAVEKTKDWAMLNHILLKADAVSFVVPNEYFYLNPSTSLIFSSKFVKKVNGEQTLSYYKIITDSLQPDFRIKKVTITFKSKIKEQERACFDYAIGNFFLTKKELRNSIMFKKMKTFFEYRPERDDK